MHIDEIVKIKAFTVVFRPNKGAHHVQSSIFHKNRLVRCTQSLEFSNFFIENLTIFGNSVALDVLTRPDLKIYFSKNTVFDLYIMRKQHFDPNYDFKKITRGPD